MEWEDYLYPGTDVLRNKAGLEDQRALHAFERGVTAVRIQELRANPVEGNFDLDHMRGIHHHVFKDVYDWAGEVRGVEISKGPVGDRTVFALTEDIPVKAALMQAAIEDAKYLRNTTKDEFSSKIAEVYAAVNDLHPFREGNGRTAREYLQQLAQKSGRSLDFTKVKGLEWNEAAKLATRGDTAPMKEVFDRIASVDRAVAFDRATDKSSVRLALAEHPELDTAFKVLHSAGSWFKQKDALRAELSETLHDGKLVDATVSRGESQRVVDAAAKHRGLIVRDANDVGGNAAGHVVAQSSHHALVRVSHYVAVRFEKRLVDGQLQAGERVAVTKQGDAHIVRDLANVAETTHGRDSSIHQMERERTLAAR